MSNNSIFSQNCTLITDKAVNKLFDWYCFECQQESSKFFHGNVVYCDVPVYFIIGVRVKIIEACEAIKSQLGNKKANSKPENLAYYTNQIETIQRVIDKLQTCQVNSSKF